VKLLDAGSTFNYEFILNHLDFNKVELSILTYAPESPNFNEKKISYVYADLREIPFRDEYFDVVLSQSTIEHIDMDNSIYGYQLQHHENQETKSYEYLKAIAEMFRVLKKGGKLLLTFPFGKFENHGFFQQFDEEMLNRILTFLDEQGTYTTNFFRYLPNGWIACEKEDCKDVESFNPHTGKGKGTDGAAHCRSICCISFQKNT
jgi:SAM-dependent methyltransferase